MAIALDQRISSGGGGGGGGGGSYTHTTTTTSGGSSGGLTAEDFKPGEWCWIYPGQNEDIYTEEATSALENIAAGAGLGSIFGGVGVIAGGLVGGISSMFGGRDEKSVSGFVEKIMAEAIPAARLNGDQTFVILDGEFRPDEVMTAVKEFARAFQKELSGDNASDVGKWIRHLKFSKRSRGDNNLVKFKVASPPATETSTTTNGDGGNGDGMQGPMQAGIGIAAGVILLGILFSQGG